MGSEVQTSRFDQFPAELAPEGAEAPRVEIEFEVVSVFRPRAVRITSGDGSTVSQQYPLAAGEADAGAAEGERDRDADHLTDAETALADVVVMPPIRVVVGRVLTPAISGPAVV